MPCIFVYTFNKDPQQTYVHMLYIVLGVSKKKDNSVPKYNVLRVLMSACNKETYARFKNNVTRYMRRIKKNLARMDAHRGCGSDTCGMHIHSANKKIGT